MSPLYNDPPYPEELDFLISDLEKDIEPAQYSGANAHTIHGLLLKF